MNVGGGEAADQLVRMMLSGSEVAVRLSGSALKNLLALTMALAKNHKTISGKVNMAKMLRETRDVRRFAMSPEQYQAFKKRAGKQKILFSAIRDTDGHGKVVEVIMPVTEIDRANLIFERIQYLGQPEQAQQPPQEATPSKAREAHIEQDAQVEQDQRHQEKGRVAPPVGQRQEVEQKKGSRSGPDSPATAPSSTSSKDESRTMSEERPSVLERLKGYKAQLDQQQKSAPARTKDRQKSKSGKVK